MEAEDSRTNAFGLHNIVNPEHVGVADIASSERTYITGEGSETPAVSAAELLNQRLAEIERSTGVDISGISEPSVEAAEQRSADNWTAGFSDDASPPSAPQHQIVRAPQSTTESHLREKIMGVMSARSMSTNEFLEAESQADEKLNMIEDIRELILILKEDGEDMSAFAVPSANESYDEILSTLKILRRMNDRRRYGALADDVIMIAATGVSELCDGKRTFFGYKPNLSGWDDHVRVKLRRMRFETSHIASSVLNDFNIGPGARIMLELLPSMFTYAHTHKAAPDVAKDTVNKLASL